AARAAMQADCDTLRNLFAGSVARYRGVSADDMLATEAATYMGANALAAKLADQVGTPADALAALTAEIARRAGMPPAQPSAQPPAPQNNVVDLAAVREQMRGE